MNYRTDIDGLRAIAVAAIVLFHINPTAIPGGFIGVDVFFVISGFLITASIRQHLEISSFSLWDFYARRVRRLFPALFAMLAGTGLLAYLFLLPSELTEFSRSALATLTYVSNIFFFTRTDYFAPAADTTVLLHTWSLSVEEQFYLLLPALLIFLRHESRSRLVLSLLLVAGISLALSEMLVRHDEAAAFFLSPSRFWQFLLGGVTALGIAAFRARPVPQQLIAALGLVGLAACLVTFRSDRPFPGLDALSPTLATCLVLYGCSVGFGPTHWLLSLRPLQWIGRWSYSIYLWHWPAIVFYRLTVNPTPSPVEQVLLGIASVTLGALSYYAVEIPTRRLRIGRPKAIVAGSLLATAGAAAIAFVPIWDGGLPQRFSPDQIRTAQYLKHTIASSGPKNCFLTSRNSGSDEYNEAECIKAADGRKSLLLIGDSHAAHFAATLPQFFPDYAISQVTASGCRPLSPTAGEERCTTLIERAVSRYIPEQRFDLILISARWAPADPAKLAKFIQGIGTAPNIAVIGPNVEYATPLPRLLVQASLNGSTRIIEQADHHEKVARIDAAVRAAVAVTPATYFSVVEVQCPNRRCRTHGPDGAPYLFDTNHFTDAGAALVLAALRERLTGQPAGNSTTANVTR